MLKILQAGILGIIVLGCSRYSQAQKPASICDQVLSDLHEGLVLGIDEKKLHEVVPDCSNKASADRVAIPGVYFEMRDLDGNLMNLSPQTARQYRYEDIGRVTFYKFRHNKLARIEQQIHINPSKNVPSKELTTKIRELLKTADLRMSLSGRHRIPTLSIVEDQQTMVVSWKEDDNLADRTRSLLQIDIYARGETPFYETVELSGRADHEAFNKFAKAFGE